MSDSRDRDELGPDSGVDSPSAGASGGDAKPSGRADLYALGGQRPRDRKSAIQILVVDDEDPVRRVVTRHLQRAGYGVVQADCAEAALQQAGSYKVQLAIIDIQMPGRDGLWLLRRLRALYPDMATMLLTAIVDVETSVHAMREGAYDYLTKPIASNDLVFAVRRALERRALERENRQYRDRLEELVSERTLQLRDAQEETLQRLALAAEYRDDDTAAHCRRIGALAAMLGERLKPGTDYSEMLRLAAPLHDIGKIGIPDSILHKPGRLTPEEFSEMERHCEIGMRILRGAKSPVLELAGTIAASHHERWNGKGYPYSLAGEAIPLEGRIVAIVDVFDALVSKRVYKPAFPVEKALGILQEERGQHFDPVIVDLFMEHIDEVHERLADNPSGTIAEV